MTEIDSLKAEIAELKEKGCRFDCRIKLKEVFEYSYYEGYVAGQHEDGILWREAYKEWQCAQSER